jgi:rod shape-determining protein MreC
MERSAESRGGGRLFDSRGELAVVVCLAALAILLMFLNDSTQAQLARHVEDFALAPFRAVDRGVRHVRELFVSNQGLREELAAVNLELARTAEMRRENERLRAMLGFEARETLELIGCEILAEGAGHLGRASVVLNRGYNDGIRVGQALAGREGLAGKVIEVRPRRSHALLLTHPDCAVAVRVERSRIAGIVEWSAGSFENLKLRNLSYLADVEVGDRVISSGLGGVFPEGITVGQVTRIEKDDTGLLLDVDVQPAVDFQTLEELFALRSSDLVQRFGGGGADSLAAVMDAEVIPFRRGPFPGADGAESGDPR